MVQDTQVVGWLFADVESTGILPHLLQAQKMIGTIKQPCIVGGRDRDLAALTLNRVGILSHSLLVFQHHRTTFPIGLQL